MNQKPDCIDFSINKSKTGTCSYFSTPSISSLTVAVGETLAPLERSKPLRTMKFMEIIPIKLMQYRQILLHEPQRKNPYTLKSILRVQLQWHLKDWFHCQVRVHRRAI